MTREEATLREIQKCYIRATEPWDVIEAAIKALKFYDKAEVVISQLRADRDRLLAEQEPCTDAVRREVVIERLKKEEKILYTPTGLNYLIRAIEELPSVTQKSGKWRRVTDKTGHLVWECDKCGWQQRFNTKFCPDCGVKMKSEDKE